MRICTWNINGIRAALGKGIKDWVLAQDLDVICFQEIKARPDQLSDAQKDFPGYTWAWNPAQRPGYSGVASLFRNPPIDVEIGLGIEKFDFEGRTLRSRHENFLLYNNYFPNGQRGQDRVDYKLDFYSNLLVACDNLHMNKENVIITGDFNTAHMPIDLRNPNENSKTSGFLPEEREWVEKFLQNGFVDVFRKKYPEVEQYTWWTYRFAARQRNIGWRIDYFLVSEAIADKVKDVVIYDDVTGSDHCPVVLDIDV